MAQDKKIKPQSFGGKATALILRKKALEKYYLNPKICLQCKKIIQVKEKQKIQEVERKNFCDRKCLSLYRTKEPIEKIIIEKIKFPTIQNKTKKEVFDNCKTWQGARGLIQKHARFVYKNSNNSKSCLKCGYINHYEVCHKKSVSSFCDDANVIEEINNINNLMALCPNHHWEYDNEILIIE